MQSVCRSKSKRTNLRRDSVPRTQERPKGIELTGEAKVEAFETQGEGISSQAQEGEQLPSNLVQRTDSHRIQRKVHKV
jgi:hypothetical protein